MRATSFLIWVTTTSLFTAAAFADKPMPSIKIDVEVVVYENDDIKVQSTPRPRYEPMTRFHKKDSLSSAGCCDRAGSDGCPKSMRNDTPLKTAETPVPGLPAKQVTRTPEIVKQIARSVMNLDQNNDGRLNADEVQPRLNTPFCDVDSNGYGYLDCGEVIRQIKRRMNATR